MIGPVANPPNAALRRGYKNIIQVVRADRITGLELHSRRAASRLEMGKCESSPSGIRIEIVIKYDAVKDGTKIVVSVPWVVIHGLIEKGQIVESARRRGKRLADRVKIGTSRTKEGAESTVGGWWQRGHAKVTSGRRRCSSPASEVAGLEIAVNDE